MTDTHENLHTLLDELKPLLALSVKIDLIPELGKLGYNTKHLEQNVIQETKRLFGLDVRLAMDAKYRWVTLKSGKKVRLNKNGYVTAGFGGFVGKHISECGSIEKRLRYVNPKKKITSYIDEARQKFGNGIKAQRVAADNYYLENLQDRYVDSNFGKGRMQIHFTGRGRSELRKNIQSGTFDVRALPFVTEVLKAKYYWRKGENTKPRKDYDGFHYFRAKVRVDGKIRTMRVDVGIRKDSKNIYEAYNLSLDEKKRNLELRRETARPRLSNDSDSDTLQVKYEFVNAYFED